MILTKNIAGFFLALCIVFTFTCCEDDEEVNHPLEGFYLGDISVYDSAGIKNTARDISLEIRLESEEKLILNFENTSIGDMVLNDYNATTINNSSFTIPPQQVGAEEHTGQGSVNGQGLLEVVVKRLSDGSDVLNYTESN